MKQVSSFSSHHFHLEQLAEGVYAAIHDQAGWAICNAGIIDLGDRTIVYDAFISPQAASDLNQAAERLTGRPVHSVINSHYHNDHIWGNQAFSSAVDIISTVKTRQLILSDGPGEIEWSRDTTPKSLEALEAQIAEERDAAKLDQLKVYLNYFQAMQAAMNILEIRLPNLTFTGDMTFEGSRRSARLIPFEGGHCMSDAILYLPSDGIVFMEDILFIDCHPYFPEGNPGIIQQILGQVRSLGANIYVPGHGPVGDPSHLDWLDKYINTLSSIVVDIISRGVPEEEIDKIAMPVEYKGMIFPKYFWVNLKYFYQRHVKN
jgi:glyoxylase-like metal-dependent hydrolase (beta-lactamase superfamily II)